MNIPPISFGQGSSPTATSGAGTGGASVYIRGITQTGVGSQGAGPWVWIALAVLGGVVVLKRRRG